MRVRSPVEAPSVSVAFLSFHFGPSHWFAPASFLRCLGNPSSPRPTQRPAWDQNRFPDSSQFTAQLNTSSLQACSCIFLSCVSTAHSFLGGHHGQRNRPDAPYDRTVGWSGRPSAITSKRGCQRCPSGANSTPSHSGSTTCGSLHRGQQLTTTAGLRKQQEKRRGGMILHRAPFQGVRNTGLRERIDTREEKI